jgi:CheY-like chemotaxis protein
MPAGGRLTIETSNAQVDAAYAAANPGVRPGDFVMVAVSDNGVGMLPDVAKRVFEPFFITKEVGKGTGLGLSMVYGFVSQSGGHVKVYSEPEQGTSVRMYLPRAGDAAKPSAAAKNGGDLDRASGEIILLVEDDELVRTYAAGQLTNLGYTLLLAGNGPEAVEMLAGEAKFDLLFTDMIMPGGMTGRDVAERARELRPGIPVLYTSGYTQDAIIHQGRLDAGVHLLSKPYRLADLARKVREVLDG